MGKVIIGIHGLKNKPPKYNLEKWWKEAIIEGFKLNKYKKKRFKFELVYWADLDYETPQDPEDWDHNNPEYLSAPYTPHEESEFEKIKEQFKKGVRKTIETGLDFIFLKDGEISGLDKVVDAAIKRKFSDLYTYYSGDCVTKPGVNAGKEFRERLLKILKKYKRHQIMLIAHSMGSIIAYDTLAEIGKKQNIDYFVTIGSPLGLPVVIKKILMEQRKNNGDPKVNSNNGANADPAVPDDREDSRVIPPTPEAIAKKWYNIADVDDGIALVSEIGKKFAPSTRNIRPFDIAVRNNYIYKGKSYPHKIYGYLRCSELSQIIHEFVVGKSWLQRIKDFFTRLFSGKK